MQRIHKYITAGVTFVILSLTCMALPHRPSPQRLVNDFADIFSTSQESALERMLVAFDDSTSNQITVVTVDDLEGYAPSDYATRLGLSWQVGSEKFNNGVVILVKPKTSSEKGETAIAVGYGLEGAIPDAYAKRIIMNEMIPHFRENDYFSGVSEACHVIMQLASGEISEPRGEDDDEGNLLVHIVQSLFVLTFILLVIGLVIKGNNNGGDGGNGKGGGKGLDADDLARAIIIGNLLGGSSRGGRSSGGWGGSGGFGGGFGGFGGGSFGGGGASGSW